MSGWIGVDFDGTLVKRHPMRNARNEFDPAMIGDGVPLMVARVKHWLTDGVDVRIVTARAWTDGSAERDLYKKAACEAIHNWCLNTFSQTLPVTCQKDYDMIELWDDRAVQVIEDTGERAVDASYAHGYDAGQSYG